MPDEFVYLVGADIRPAACIRFHPPNVKKLAGRLTRIVLAWNNVRAGTGFLPENGKNNPGFVIFNPADAPNNPADAIFNPADALKNPADVIFNPADGRQIRRMRQIIGRMP